MDEKKAPYRILLVDDEAAITDSLAPFLERAGLDVAVAEDGIIALHKVEEFHPDLVVLDVLMPRLGGREVLRRIRHAGNWTPVILLTQVGSPRRCRRPGGSGRFAPQPAGRPLACRRAPPPLG